jgi:GDPmannose 4,6-dehydratase
MTITNSRRDAHRAGAWRMPTAFITGVSGQDGSYLAELLISQGYRVIGSSRSTNAARSSLPEALRDRVELVQWDLRSEPVLKDIFASYRPDEVYNCAAYTSGSGQFDQPVEMAEINGLAVARLLEAVKSASDREPGKPVRFCQASSSELFADSTVRPLTERTPFAPKTPYGAAKLYAHEMVRVYRRTYQTFACSAILFNHESPRRGPDFVTRRVARGAARIKLGLDRTLQLGRLDSERDWGFAGDHVRAMWLMLRAEAPDDYVIATGQPRSVRELCDEAFRYVGLDYRDYVTEDPAAYRIAEPAMKPVADPSLAKRKLGWEPRVGFSQMIAMMVDAELAALNV